MCVCVLFHILLKKIVFKLIHMKTYDLRLSVHANIFSFLKKTKQKCLLLLLLLLPLFIVNPATSIDCMDAGNTGYPTELKCKILRYLTMGIFWVRPDSAVVVKCSINNTRCTSTEGPPGQYTGVAHSSTANTLKIKSFNPETEAGTWICRDGDHGAKSSCVKTHSIVISK